MRKDSFSLSFALIGLITLVYQLAAWLLLPFIGFYTDHNPKPYSLPVGGLHADRPVVAVGGAGGHGLVGVPSGIVAGGAHGLGRAPWAGAVAVPGGRQRRLGAGAAAGGEGSALGSDCAAPVAGTFALAQGSAWLVRATPMGRGCGASGGTVNRPCFMGFRPIQLSISAKGGSLLRSLAYSLLHTAQPSWRYAGIGANLARNVVRATERARVVRHASNKKRQKCRSVTCPDAASGAT